jgi:hypothetical protein
MRGRACAGERVETSLYLAILARDGAQHLKLVRA